MTEATTTTDINKLLADLAWERHQIELCKQRKAQWLEELHRLPDWVATEQYLKMAEEHAAQLTEQIHIWGHAEHQRTGKKSFHPAVKIKTFATLAYDFVTALEWSKIHLVEALTLDKKFFETYATTMAEKKPVPCVMVVNVDRVQIAQDLTEYLEENPF